MRATRNGSIGAIARVVGAGALLATLAGCQMMGMRPPYGEDGGAPSPKLPASAIGALIFGAEGEIYVVDGAGRNVPGCVLPGTMDKSAPECRALAGTTVLAIKSVAAVRHTGSTCTTVGPIISAGRAYYFQLPAGCAP
ncbi:hypothetical protein [Aromatoleum petrolei]|uniref:Lipoprotein n=1 Tax=Aromatoleum petrolei TaxID=76116 RepID=A0ABX1MZK4_9RHOO|nr:hypothetical protein [Aromatoleum petrolei]NMF91499.1 hypothetical protein [Aromatoleum petrolei]QTQ34408.1 Uncharacterized protein ToN1_02260 [Aromatoleum petrolei]